MSTRRRRHDQRDLPVGRPPILSLVHRISAAGTLTVVMVASALCAVVERAILANLADESSAGTVPAVAAPRVPKANRAAARPAPVTALVQEVRKLTLAQHGQTASRAYGTTRLGRPLVLASRVDHKRAWAVGTAVIPPPRGTDAMPELAFFLAHATGGPWRIALPGSESFSGMLLQAPRSLISEDEKRLLARYSSGKSPGTDKLMLPWKVGESWAMVPGSGSKASKGSKASSVDKTDKNSRAAPSSVGFAGGDGKVQAAGDGRLYRFCSTAPDRGLILVIHPSGLATVYDRMTNVTKLRDGSPVKQGDYLGRVGTTSACGGKKAARQMRFGLWHGDRDVPLDGAQLGGWTFQEKADTRVVAAERDGKLVPLGKTLRNFGIGVGLTPSSPSPGPGSGGLPIQVPGLLAAPAPRRP